MKIKEFIKENYKFILFIIFTLLIFNIKLPYYVLAPGGTIDITNRVEMDGYKNTSGSLNMLYVSEYDGTIPSLLLAKLMDYDIEDKEERQISNETTKEIEKRDKLLRDNSLNNAIYAAYTEAGKEITIKNKQNIVVGVTSSSDFQIGDIISKVDNIECDTLSQIKEIINSKEVGDIISFTIIRDNKEITIDTKVYMEDNTKIVGIVIITNYDYEINPSINIKFKNSESGSSGGLMLALTIYNAISGEDIIKGRNIAGTGTISTSGAVGEIDGIKYKIMGANKNNIDLVLVPSANYEEALSTKEKYNYDMEIVKVDTLKEAINYLKNN